MSIQSHRQIPALEGAPLFGNLFEADRDFLGLLLRASELGDVVQIKLVKPVLLVNRPDLIKRVLQDNHLNYRKGFIYDRLTPLVGRGLLTSEGDFWKRQRRLAQPAFHKKRLASFVDLMARHTNRMLDRWDVMAETKTPFDVHAEMMRLTLTIVGEALFGVDLNTDASDVGKALTVALEIIDERFRSLWVTPSFVPTPSNIRFRRALAALDAMVVKIIEGRRAQNATGDDLLGMLMEARDEEGKGMTDAQLRDEVMTLVLAGHETTANALTWWTVCLSRNPQVAERQSAEASSVLNGRVPLIDDLPKLPYTMRTFDETLRLHPPAYAFGREAIQADELDGYPVPPGRSVMLVPFVTHRDARYWDNPEGFDPDRFLPERSAGRPPMAYYPFAAGPRQCIGNSFALMEMQVIGSMIAQRFRLELLPVVRIEASPQVTLRPKEAVRVMARRLAAAPQRPQVVAATA